jgi:hypothetical protein
MEFGARASMRNIQTWFSRGKNTIEKLISTWAPSTENDTQAYIDFMARRLGVGPTQVLTLTPFLLQEIAYAIAIQENGLSAVQKYLPREIYAQAYRLL